MIDGIIALGPYQWIGLVFGIIYIFFAIQEKPICWIFGIVSCTSIAIEDFTHTKLYQDGVLQIIYVALGMYGLYQWRYSSDVDNRSPKRLQLSYAILIGVIGVFLSLCVAFGFARFTDASFPVADAITTIFSIVATFLLIYKYIENWLLWIVIDIAYMYLYYDTAAPLFSILYFIFTIMAVIGYVRWRRLI